MKRLMPLALLLAAGCLKQGTSYSPPKMEANKLFASDLDGKVGQDFRGHLFYYFEAADATRGQRRATIDVIDPLPPGLKETFNTASMDTWITGRPTKAGTWKLKIEISDAPTGRKINDTITITVKP